MADTRALIITGGDVDIDFAAKQESYDLVVAVDGGLSAADAMGLVPDVLIGDFDTISEDLLKCYQKLDGIKTVSLNPMKDDTDTQAAVRYVMEAGIKFIDMLGGTGSRLDHTLANLFLMKMAYEQGVEIILHTKLSRIYLISGCREYKREDFFGKYISFIQFDGAAKGVTLEGFMYNVVNFDFDTKKTYRLGVSNEPAEETARICIREGYMLVVESLEDK